MHTRCISRVEMESRHTAIFSLSRFHSIWTWLFTFQQYKSHPFYVFICNMLWIVFQSWNFCFASFIVESKSIGFLLLWSMSTLYYKRICMTDVVLISLFVLIMVIVFGLFIIFRDVCYFPKEKKSVHHHKQS